MIRFVIVELLALVSVALFVGMVAVIAVLVQTS